MKSLEDKMKEPGGVAMVNFWMGFIIASIIGGVIIFFMVRHAENEHTARILDNSRNQVKIATSEAMAKFHKDRGNDLQAELVLTRDSFKVAQKPLYEENRALKKKIEIWRPLVAQKIEADPDLKEFSGAQDSAILVQSEIIASLEIEKANEIKKNDEIRNENRAEVNELVLMTNSLQESLVNEQSESRKWKKKAEKRGGFGVQIGYGVTSTGGEIRTGPTINVGFQYRLFRF